MIDLNDECCAIFVKMFAQFKGKEGSVLVSLDCDILNKFIRSADLRRVSTVFIHCKNCLSELLIEDD